MADNELGAQTDVEAVDASAHQDAETVATTIETSETTEAPAPNPVEALAQELGWTPKEQFRGDPEAWKPADEFIRAGRDIQRNLSRDVKELKQNVGRIVQASTATLEQQLAETRQKLESQHNEAVELGDAPKAREIAVQIDRLESTARQTAIPSEAADFAERNNSWFQKDPLATNLAITIADREARAGRSAAEQVAAAEREVKKRFPELFPAPAKPAPSVAAPPTRAAAASSRAKTFHDLPAEAQAIARDMQDRLGIPTTTYVKNYFEQRRG